MTTDYSKEQLIDCLISQWNDNLEEEWTRSAEEDYTAHLKTLSYEQLIEETGTDKDLTIQEFIYAYS